MLIAIIAAIVIGWYLNSLFDFNPSAWFILAGVLAFSYYIAGV